MTKFFPGLEQINNSEKVFYSTTAKRFKTEPRIIAGCLFIKLTYCKLLPDIVLCSRNNTRSLHTPAELIWYNYCGRRRRRCRRYNINDRIVFDMHR